MCNFPTAHFSFPTTQCVVENKKCVVGKLHIHRKCIVEKNKPKATQKLQKLLRKWCIHIIFTLHFVIKITSTENKTSTAIKTHLTHASPILHFDLYFQQHMRNFFLWSENRKMRSGNPKMRSCQNKKLHKMCSGKNLKKKPTGIVLSFSDGGNVKLKFQVKFLQKLLTKKFEKMWLLQILTWPKTCSFINWSTSTSAEHETSSVQLHIYYFLKSVCTF